MTITSPTFSQNASIPSTYTCDGKNISPPLHIDDVPAGTKSLVLIVDDPDVPKHLRADGMWDHWIVFNILPTTRDIAEGEKPAGVYGTGTSGDTAYHGPCPPDREHRYFFKLYALDTTLELPSGAGKPEVEQVMQGHILDQAELIGRYQRKPS